MTKCVLIVAAGVIGCAAVSGCSKKKTGDDGEVDSASETEGEPLSGSDTLSNIDTETLTTMDRDSATETDSGTEAPSPLELTVDSRSLFAGGDHTCFVEPEGAVWCWGANAGGQLGDGTRADSWSPVKVLGAPENVAQMALGARHTCALTADGAVWCWGANPRGELGRETDCYGAEAVACTPEPPTPVPGLETGVAAISSGLHHTCALLSDGRVSCFGSNNYGQLGDGQAIEDFGCSSCYSAEPLAVVRLDEGAVAVTSGKYHACAALATGGVKCWGWNVNGELGRGEDCGEECDTGVPDRWWIWRGRSSPSSLDTPTPARSPNRGRWPVGERIASGSSVSYPEIPVSLSMRPFRWKH